MIIQKYLILTIFILFNLSNISAQSDMQTRKTSVALDTTLNFILNKMTNQYSVHFLIIDSVDNKDTPYTIYKSDIYDNSHKLIQTISDTIPHMSKNTRQMIDRYSDEPEDPIFNNDISFVDINFDGYTDIKIKRFVDMQGQSAFRYFLYSPESNEFIYNEDFSTLCCRVSLHPKSKEISISEYRWQDETNTIIYFKVINNKPVHVRTRTEYVFTEDNIQKYRTKIEKLIDGKFEVIKDTTFWKGM